MTRSERQRQAYLEYKEQQMQSPTFRAVYEKGLDWLKLSVSMALLRRQRKLSQAELARRIKTSQSIISRLERGKNIELKTLDKIAEALDAELKIELITRHSGDRASERADVPYSMARSKYSR